MLAPIANRIILIYVVAIQLSLFADIGHVFMHEWNSKRKDRGRWEDQGNTGSESFAREFTKMDPMECSKAEESRRMCGKISADITRGAVTNM